MRSLVAERKKDWQQRFRTLGLRVVELSGDSFEKEGAAYMEKVHESDIIITTPEKLDAVSRRFTADSKALLASVTLLMVDEIHLLADDRGAVSLRFDLFCILFFVHSFFNIYRSISYISWIFVATLGVFFMIFLHWYSIKAPLTYYIIFIFIFQFIKFNIDH